MWCERVQLNSGTLSDGKKLFCGGTEQYIFSSPNKGAQRGRSVFLHVTVFDRNQNDKSIRDFALVSEGRRSRGKHGRAKGNGYSWFSVCTVVNVILIELWKNLQCAQEIHGPIPAPPVRNLEE